MARACLILADDAIRAKARHWVDIAPRDARVTFQDPKRTDAQNRKFWPMLTDLSEQVDYHGVKLTADDFKLLFLDALKREVRLVPNLDGNGFVNLGKSSSDLSVGEMSDCIEIMYRFGAERGVKWTEPEPDMPPAAPDTKSEADQGGGVANNGPADGQPAQTLSDRVNVVKVAMAKATDTASLDAIWRRAGPLRKELEQADPEGLLVDVTDGYEGAGRAVESTK